MDSYLYGNTDHDRNTPPLHIHTDSLVHSDTDSNGNANPNSDEYPDVECHSNADSDTDSDSNRDWHAHTLPVFDAGCDVDAFGHADSDRNPLDIHADAAAYVLTGVWRDRSRNLDAVRAFPYGRRV